jgi:DnaJ-class molecular chaperone
MLNLRRKEDKMSDRDPQPRPCPDCGGNPSEDECINCGGDGWVED